MSGGFTDLNPLHIPQVGSTGIARAQHESAYPELWNGHVATMAPCLFGHGDVFPGIGYHHEMKGSANIALRRYAWQTGIGTGHDEISPIGYGFNLGAGAHISAIDFAAWAPWYHYDGQANQPHTYVVCFKVTASHGSTTIQYLFQNNTKLVGPLKWKGEFLGFNSFLMAPFVGAGDNTTTTLGVAGADYITTQDNTIIEDKWHCIAWVIRDWDDPDPADVAELYIDGKQYPGFNMTGTGTTVVPVYVGTPATRWFWHHAKTSQELAMSLFQVFDHPMTPDEAISHTSDPTKMFLPRRLVKRRIRPHIEAAAVSPKTVSLGRLQGMNEIVLAGTSQ